jgi:hypothetical protein
MSKLYKICFLRYSRLLRNSKVPCRAGRNKGASNRQQPEEFDAIKQRLYIAPFSYEED